MMRLLFLSRPHQHSLRQIPFLHHSHHPHPIKSRPFSSSPLFNLRSTELQDSNFRSLRASSSRLWSDIHRTAEFGTGTRYGDGIEQTGLSRLALSENDKKVRDWFVQTTTDLGCDVSVDQIGNVFAVRKGVRNDVATTFVGSHLDSQPNGGRFDGVLGVCAGVEMVRVLNENWIETEGPVGVVNWTNEEGARWKNSMMGSGVWAGKREVDEVWGLRDEKGISVKEALEEIGYLGDAGVSAERAKMAGHFELHIEQGKVLEREKKQVGVVNGVQGYKWFTITVEGRQGHAGATAWVDRSDALRLSSFILRQIYDLAERHSVLATVGTIQVENGSVNTIPGKIVMTLDVRGERLEAFVQELKSIAESAIDKEKTGSGAEYKFHMHEDFSSQPVQFDEKAMDCVRQSAQNVVGGNGEVRSMASGAGHDSVNTNLHCPTAMIFVPCRDGITHNPEEWCKEEDCKIGTDVLIESVLRFDRWRHSQGHFD